MLPYRFVNRGFQFIGLTVANNTAGLVIAIGGAFSLKDRLGNFGGYFGLMFGDNRFVVLPYPQRPRAP